MAEPSTQPNTPPATEPIEANNQQVEPEQFWPWWLKGAIALALAIVWLAVLAEPALGILQGLNPVKP